MSNPWPQVFRGRGSVYALDEHTKQWADRGTSGIVIMFQNAQDRQDVRIKWEKNQHEVWWRLTSSKLKPKGERALVLKAWATSTNQQEILAIRFSHQEAAIQFAKKYHNIFPMAISGTSQIENIFNASHSNQNELNKHNGNSHYLQAKHHASMASLPGSVIGDIGDEDKQFASFQPQQYNPSQAQYNPYNNQNNNEYINHRQSNPPPPPRNNKRGLPPPRAQAQSQYIHNGQIVNKNVLQNINNNKPLPPNPPINGIMAPPQFKPGNMPDLDPLPAQPHAIAQPVSQLINKFNHNNGHHQNGHNHNGHHNGHNSNGHNNGKRMVKASPDMKPPVWNKPLPLPQLAAVINNDPIELEYGHVNKKQEWKCAVCTYQNQQICAKCAMCGLPKKPAQKPKPKPKPNNGKLDDDDDIYEDPDELGGGPQQKMGGDAKGWRCGACTFSNPSWRDRCELCSAKRRNPVADKPHHLKIGPKKQEAISLHHQMSAQIEQEIMDSDVNPPIGSPVYNSIPDRKFLFEQQGDVNQQPWSCPICTLLNRATNARCEACNTARSVNPYHGLHLDLQENQVNDMMNHMINKPEQQYQPQPQQQQPFDAQNQAPPSQSQEEYDDDYQRMMNMSMGVHGNPYNINLQFDYNDPFKSNPYDNDDNFFASTAEDFSRAASDIACYNNTPSSVFSTLRSVAKKLLKDDPRYRTLDTTNPKVMERLIGFEGVLDFLMLLGFESDAMGMKLICQKKPSQKVVHNAITVLNSYQHRFRMTDNGYGGMGMGVDNMAMGMGINEAISPNNGVQTPHGGGGGFDDVNNIGNENKNDILTLEQIILWSTHENMQDNDTMETLIMTHKMFTDSLTLLKQLRKRFFVPIPPDILNNQNQQDKQTLIQEFQTGVQKRIQLKVIKAVRDWMKHYWSEDFDKNEDVQLELQEWLKELSVYHELDIHNRNCVWISKLYDAVWKEHNRLKNINWDEQLEQQMNILNSFNDVSIGDLNKMNTYLAKSTAEELADQITLMDYRLFSAIEPRECVHQRWKDQNNKKLAPNILSLIQQFNNFTIFIQIQILRERSLKKRGTAIKRIIKMGQHFKLTRNYNSLCAVFSALNSAPIHRLKLAWGKVPERQRQNFEEWSRIFCRDFNHRNLRQLLRKAGGNPCIPHIGVFLQDLVFIDEGNKKKLAIPAFNGNQMLNFNKCVRIADRIKNLQLFQHHKYSNNITENRKIQKVLLMEFEKTKDVTEDQIWDMSTEIKKQDQREARQPLGFFGGGGNKNVPNQIPPAQPAQ